MHIHQGFSLGVCSINKSAFTVPILLGQILMCRHPAWYVFVSLFDEGGIVFN